MSRHPAPDPPDQEQLLVIVAGVIAAACIVVWTAGQLSGRIWGGAWPQASPIDSPLILARLIANPSEPSTAWPEAAADLIPAPAAYYGVLALLVVAATIIAVVAWRLWQWVAAPDDDGAR